MNRKELIRELSTIADVKNIGQSYKHSDVPYMVLKSMGEQGEANGSYGGYQMFNILCYVPDTSAVMLDGLVNAVKNKVFELEREGVEYAGELGVDYHDEEIRMYMTYVAIRIPKQIRM